MQEPSAIEMLVRMADQALFCLEPSVTVNNTEGALLLQIIFQIFQGTDVLNNYFENIMNRVLDRSSQQPCKPSLKKHILTVFLSALIYNSSATLKFMEMKGVSKTVLSDILSIKKQYKSNYEQKCFIVGITHILRTEDAPDVFKNPATVTRLIQEVLSMLEIVQKKEEKEASKKARKQIQQEDNDSDDNTSSESEDYDDEEDVVTELDNRKRSRSNSSHRDENGNEAEEMMEDEEESKQPDGGATNEFGLGLTDGKGKPDKDSESDSSDDEYDNAVSIPPSF